MTHMPRVPSKGGAPHAGVTDCCLQAALSFATSTSCSRKQPVLAMCVMQHKEFWEFCRGVVNNLLLLGKES